MSNNIHTVDAVVTCGKWVVLIKRTKPPFEDKLVLPGGHVEEGEDFEKACYRELDEEIGLSKAYKNKGGYFPGGAKFLTLLDGDGRDPRQGERISVVFHLEVPEWVLFNLGAGSDARQVVIAEWKKTEPEDMGFDHYLALEAMKRRFK